MSPAKKHIYISTGILFLRLYYLQYFWRTEKGSSIVGSKYMPTMMVVTIQLATGNCIYTVEYKLYGYGNCERTTNK